MQNGNEQQTSIYARSIADAAKAIGVGRSTFYELIGAKQIRTFKVGKRTLIADSELQRFVTERMETPA